VADGCRLRQIEFFSFEVDAALLEPTLSRVHRDPSDRMLICQALAHGLTILTPDPLIRRYLVATDW
jgi:PIN domain nuclease of toxin-antitoxin system